MATANISQTFTDGSVFEIVLDSDLDSLAEVGAAALCVWREAFAADTAEDD